MRRISLGVREIGFIAGTRAAFGAGLGLLLADRLNRRRRRKVGRVLVAIGAVTTVPVVVRLVRKAKESLGTAA